jgi:nidogen-like/IPT/TIG domain-containing protein/putative Ig domain-containing protein
VRVTRAFSVFAMSLLLPMGTVVTTSAARPATAARTSIRATAAAPAVTRLSRREGSTAGRTRVTVRGRHLTHVRKVMFGNARATHVVRLSSTRLRVTTPRHRGSHVNVRVVTTHGVSRRTPRNRYTFARQLTITSTSLGSATAGLRYLHRLGASGGSRHYRWSARGLPSGFSLSRFGVLTGSPTRTGVYRVAVTLADSLGWRVTRHRLLHVPTALPPGCVTTGCSDLTLDGGVTEVPATAIARIGYGPDGSPSDVHLTGTPPATGEVLVLAPTPDAPSGLTVVVDGVTPRDDGTSEVAVSRADLGQAYAAGTVKAVGPPATAQSASPPAVDCTGSRPDLYGMDVRPSLAPTVAATWRHPVVDTGGAYAGTGGLGLFQLDLDGDVSVNLGLAASGDSGTCTLQLPRYRAAVPARGLGAVVLDMSPTVTFRVNGKVSMRTSFTLHCGAEYRWIHGHESRAAYCVPHTNPLRVTARNGVDLDLTGGLATSLTLDGTVGVRGSLGTRVHAGYHAARHPVAEVGARVAYNLGGCLACLWKDSPAHVSVASGAIFIETIRSYDRRPPAAPASGPPVITTTSLPQATLGTPYSARLRTADSRAGTWSVSSRQLPDGLALDGDTLVGKPMTLQTSAFTVTFVDTAGHSASTNLSIVVASTSGRAAQGAIENLDYCRQHVLPADQDGSVVVAAPFDVTLQDTDFPTFYVNNNGYVRFAGPTSLFYTTPFPLAESTAPMVAPFFADVDTRSPASRLVTYGTSEDQSTFCVDWQDVGYDSEHADRLDSFQLLLRGREDIESGAVEATFNYGPMSWETGDASGGTDGLGGVAARAGYTDGTGDAGTVELPGSGVPGALLDGGPHSLSAGSANSGVPGRYVYVLKN